MGEFFRLCWGGKVVSLYLGGEGTKGVGVGRRHGSMAARADLEDERVRGGYQGI
jgi:phytoene dehydrogenase-like protein